MKRADLHRGHKINTVFQVSPPKCVVSASMARNTVKRSQSCVNLKDRVQFCAMLGVDYERSIEYLEMVRDLDKLYHQERLESPPHLLLQDKPTRPSTGVEPCFKDGM